LPFEVCDDQLLDIKNSVELEYQHRGDANKLKSEFEYKLLQREKSEEASQWVLSFNTLLVIERMNYRHSDLQKVEEQSYEKRLMALKIDRETSMLVIDDSYEVEYQRLADVINGRTQHFLEKIR
jgi:hypothetical protein